MNYLRTWRGNDVHFAAPRIETIDIRDIAHHLSMIPRFNAGTEMPYFVSQHSVLVSTILAGKKAPPWLQMLGLLHDAHEAYVGDITSPMRREIWRRVGRDIISEITAPIDAAIFARFRLAPISQAASNDVMAADRTAFIAEWRCLMPGPCPEQGDPGPVKSVKPWPRDKAEATFLETFHALEREMGPVPGFVPTGILK